MTEQKQQAGRFEIKEIFHFASHIIRLTWIILLSLLLAVGLFFQLPWKVTAFVLIFLLAAAILPRAYRKWFWAGVLCAGAAVIVWVFLPEDNKVWRPYTFDKELAVLKTKYVIPDGENAATIYNELLENCDSNSFCDGLPDSEMGKLPLRKPWLSGEHPEIAKWLEEHQTTIDMLLNASKIEQCRFPINPDVKDIRETMYRLAMMKRWANVFISAANNDAAEGRAKEEFYKYIAALQMGEHQRQQPSMIDFLVGVDIEGLLFNQLNRFIVTGDATEERLSLAEQALARIKRDWGTDLPRILDYEKLLTKNFWGTFYAIGPDGKVRLGCDVPAAYKARGDRQVLPSGYWQKKLNKSENIWYWFYMPSTPEQAGAIVDAVYERCYATAEPDFDWRKRPRGFSVHPIRFNCHYMIGMQLCGLESAYYGIHNMYLQNITQQRGSSLIIALRRYKNRNGNWPQSLDDIRPSAPEEIFVDPLNGGPFVYKLTDAGFTLYSKGENGIDDGGKNDKWDEEQTGADDHLIWLSENSNPVEKVTANAE